MEALASLAKNLLWCVLVPFAYTVFCLYLSAAACGVSEAACYASVGMFFAGLVVASIYCVVVLFRLSSTCASSAS